MSQVLADHVRGIPRGDVLQLAVDICSMGCVHDSLGTLHGERICTDCFSKGSRLSQEILACITHLIHEIDFLRIGRIEISSRKDQLPGDSW